MIDPTAPDVTYDTAIDAGWTYHRNGVGGRPFWATVIGDKLHIRSDAGSAPIRLDIPLPMFDTGHARGDWVGPFNVWRADGVKVGLIAEAADGATRFTIADLDSPGEGVWRCLLVEAQGDGRLEAAFRLADLVDGGDASWCLRGDVIATLICRARAE